MCTRQKIKETNRFRSNIKEPLPISDVDYGILNNEVAVYDKFVNAHNNLFRTTKKDKICFSQDKLNRRFNCMCTYW